MSVASRAYKRLCDQYRVVLSRMRELNARLFSPSPAGVCLLRPSPAPSSSSSRG